MRWRCLSLSDIKQGRISLLQGMRPGFDGFGAEFHQGKT